MAKTMNHFGAHQQKMFLTDSLQIALKEHKAAKDGTPFEYRHYGFLYPRVKTFFEKMGFTLTWHKDSNNEKDMYWSFMLPKDVEIDSDSIA